MRRAVQLAAVSALSLLTLRASADCPSTAGDCQALLETGPTGGRVDFVIVGDGYTAAERDKFYADAAAVAADLESASTYASYAPVFNVWALFVPSAESGADDPATSTMVETAFDATYGFQGIDYLIGINTGAVFAEINERLPERDLAICLVNAGKYGGSGGPVAVTSTHPDSLRILEHEMGHSFAGLADEYETPYPGYPPGDFEPNVALLENLDPLKWSAWVTPGTPIPTSIGMATSDYDPVGAYEGARYLSAGVFRPSPSCRMRELGFDFCPVCAEAVVLGFSELRYLVDDVTPAEGTVVPASGTTVLSAVVPALSDLSVSWSVDGVIVEGAVTSELAFDPTALGLADGPHAITVTVSDDTPLVRTSVDGLMTATFTRNLVVDSTLPPVDGEGGAGGASSAGNGSGGAGSDDGDREEGHAGCSCRIGGAAAARGNPLLALLALLALGRRRRSRSAAGASPPR